MSGYFSFYFTILSKARLCFNGLLAPSVTHFLTGKQKKMCLRFRKHIPAFKNPETIEMSHPLHSSSNNRRQLNLKQIMLFKGLTSNYLHFRLKHTVLDLGRKLQNIQGVRM